MTIGDFSRATGLTAKALRLYHGEGLLMPEEVHPTSDYRLYSADQLFDARVIRKLRELEVPVPEIRQIVSTTETATRAMLLAQHADRLEQQARRASDSAHELRRLLAGDPTSVAISYERRSPQRVIGVRGTIDLAGLGEWFDASMRRLSAFLQRAKVSPAGPFGGVWSTELFRDERGSAMLYAPIEDAVADIVEVPGSGEVQVMQLPAVDLAVTTSRGSDDNVRAVYAALGAHVARHELSIDAPIRESYIAGLPGRDADAVVEIGWPIFRIAR